MICLSCSCLVVWTWWKSSSLPGAMNSSGQNCRVAFVILLSLMAWLQGVTYLRIISDTIVVYRIRIPGSWAPRRYSNCCAHGKAQLESDTRTLAYEVLGWCCDMLRYVAICCDYCTYIFHGSCSGPSPRQAASAFAGTWEIYLLKTSLTALSSGCTMHMSCWLVFLKRYG